MNIAFCMHNSLNIVDLWTEMGNCIKWHLITRLLIEWAVVPFKSVTVDTSNSIRNLWTIQIHYDSIRCIHIFIKCKINHFTKKRMQLENELRLHFDILFIFSSFFEVMCCYRCLFTESKYEGILWEKFAKKMQIKDTLHGISFQFTYVYAIKIPTNYTQLKVMHTITI